MFLRVVEQMTLMSRHSFKPSGSVQEPKGVEWAVHTSVMEVFALIQEEIAIDQIYKSWDSVLSYEDLAANTAAFEKLPNGSVKLKFTDEKKRQEIIKKLFTDHVVGSDAAGRITAAVDESTEKASQGGGSGAREDSLKAVETDSSQPGENHILEEQSAPAKSFEELEQEHGPLDKSWVGAPLTDPTIKFAIMKRASQILGLRIHDPDILKINDMPSLMQTLTKKPKPRKLKEEIGINDRLKGLMNLEIYDKRWTLHH